MKVPDRQFDSSLAVRAQTPALVGLMGPSGGGKTYSALRLATGMQRVRGGEIYYVDTEARRALHYADKFKFNHVPFDPPFGSLDYLSVLRYCVNDKKAGVVVVDSMSHEHEGEGGYLATHEAELDRMAGNDYEKREKVKFAAWIKPAAQRRALINGLLQMNAAFIFCFRAKEKIKPVRGGQPLDLGFMPIAGEEFLFEMTANALLMPHADGVPTWKSEKVGEKMMMKLPAQFRDLFAQPTQITEEHGVAIAEWARGGTAAEVQPKPARKAGGSVDDRVKAFEERLRKATSPVDVETAWRLAGVLRQEVDPATLDRISMLYDARLNDFSEVAK